MVSQSRTVFFQSVVTTVRQTAPPAYTDFAVRQFANILQLSIGPDPRIHYEVWVDVRRNHLEIGLHCESDPTTTLRLLGCLDRSIVAIKHALGPDVELARWTQSWGRLVEFHPPVPIDAVRGEAIGKRLADFMAAIQPVLDDCDGSRPV